MAGPYLVSCTEPLKCPATEKFFVRHVILKKETKDAIQPREVKNSLMINQLVAEGGKQQVWDKLLTVEFSSYSEEVINGILSRGVELDGSQYFFLGFTESQLKKKTCFLINEIDQKISGRRAKFGYLTSAIPFADRVATVQHMFEPFEKSVQLAKGEFEFEHHDNETVSSGFMSPELAEQIRATCGLAEKPSVVQVICPGFSGTLVLSNEICGRASEIDRPSNQRIKALFKIPADAAADNGSDDSLTMGIVDCAKPYKVGYLDVYSVMFLEERGVTCEYLLELQRHYHEVLKQLGQADLTHSKHFLRQTGRQELLSTIEHGITNGAKGKISKIKEDEIGSMKNGTETELRVFVSMSREVFGIEDPYKGQDKALKSDECVFLPCMDCMSAQEKELFDSATQILVIPQPCYKSEDVRVLTLVRDKGEYEHLKDCIVLPSQPEAPVIANKYFVSWDRNLMAQKSDSYLELITNNALPWLRSQILKKLPALSSLSCREEPSTRHSFKGVKEIRASQEDGNAASTSNEVDISFQDDLKKYFANYKSNDGLVSSAKEHFESFAAIKNPSCTECTKLGKYLSPSFDWNTKRGEVEKYLAKLDIENPSPDAEETQASATQSSTPQPVWREMTKEMNEFIARKT